MKMDALQAARLRVPGVKLLAQGRDAVGKRDRPLGGLAFGLSDDHLCLAGILTPYTCRDDLFDGSFFPGRVYPSHLTRYCKTTGPGDDNKMKKHALRT